MTLTPCWPCFHQLPPCAAGAYALTPAGYHAPLGSATTNASAVVYYENAGNPAPQVPTPGHVGSWHFPNFQLADAGAVNPAGWIDRGFSNVNFVVLVVVGQGTLRVHTRDPDGASATINVVGDNSTGTAEVTVASGPVGVPIDLVIDGDTWTDGDCVYWFRLTAAGGTVGFDGVTWTPAAASAEPWGGQFMMDVVMTDGSTADFQTNYPHDGDVYAVIGDDLYNLEYQSSATKDAHTPGDKHPQPYRTTFALRPGGYSVEQAALRAEAEVALAAAVASVGTPILVGYNRAAGGAATGAGNLDWSSQITEYEARVLVRRAGRYARPPGKRGFVDYP